MVRVTREGGTVATCKWDFQNGMPMLSLVSRAAEAVASEAVARYRAGLPVRPTYDHIESIAVLWESCGLSKIRRAILEVSLEFSSFGDLWLPFLGGSTGNAAFGRDLDKATGGAVAEHLRELIQTEYGSGTSTLTARAFAVAGTAPRV